MPQREHFQYTKILVKNAKKCHYLPMPKPVLVTQSSCRSFRLEMAFSRNFLSFSWSVSREYKCKSFSKLQHLLNTFTFKPKALVTTNCPYQLISMISLTRSLFQPIEILSLSGFQNGNIFELQISQFSVDNVWDQLFSTFCTIFSVFPSSKMI